MIRQVVEQLLIKLREDLDEIPEIGEFADRRHEAVLPPPYGPTRRLVLTLTAANGYPELRQIEARVDDGHGSSLQNQFLGTSAELREQLVSNAAITKIGRSLEPVLAYVDNQIDAVQPLDVPLVAISRDGVLFGALDARRTEFEQWSPGDLHIAKWHLLLRAGDSLRDVGVAQ